MPAGRKDACGDEDKFDRKPRLRQVRNRLIAQTIAALVCTLLLYLSLSHMLGPVFTPYWRQTAWLFL